MTDINQINNYLTLLQKYDNLNDQEILSYLKTIPEEWAKNVLRERIIISYGKVTDDEFKKIVESVTQLCESLDFQLEPTIYDIDKEYGKFKIKKTILSTSIQYIDKYYEGEKIDFEYLGDDVIDLIKEISIQTEHYELLTELKNKKLI